MRTQVLVLTSSRAPLLLDDQGSYSDRDPQTLPVGQCATYLCQNRANYPRESATCPVILSAQRSMS